MYKGADHDFKLPVPKSGRLEKAKLGLKGIIDDFFGLYCLLLEKGIITHEEVVKMQRIAEDVRLRLGRNFTIEEGLKIIRTTYRLETREKDKGGS